MADLPLRRDEKINKRAIGRMVTTNENVKGELILTNQRIVFQREVGLIFKKTDILFMADVNNITTCRVSGVLGKTLNLDYIPAAGTPHHIKFKIPDPIGWSGAVNSTISGTME